MAAFEIPDKLIPVFTPEHVRYRGAYGGRGSAKTFTFAKMLVILTAVMAQQGKRGIVLCGREFMNSLADSSMEEIKQAIQSEPWLAAAFDMGEKFIRTKCGNISFAFVGLTRNLESIKSKASILIAWIDEAEAVSEYAWAKLIPTVRAPNSEIWVTWNPETMGSATDNRFRQNPPDDSVIVEINHTDNPWFPDVLEGDRLRDLQIFGQDYHDWIWGGEYRADSVESVIRGAWIKSAIDFHLTFEGMDSGRKRIGFDIADDGNDKSATTYVHGSVVFEIEEWSGDTDQLQKTFARAHSQAVRLGAEIAYDSIGIGSGAGSKFNDINKTLSPSNRIKHHRFNAGGKVYKPESNYMPGLKNKDFFGKIKDQAWWAVADRFRRTHEYVTAMKNGEPLPTYTADEMISISSKVKHLDQLVRELSMPRRDYDSNGRVKVEGKDDLAKRGIPSPNIADSFVIAYAPITSGLKINPRNIR